MDLKGMLQSVTKKDYLRYQVWLAEKLNGEMREENKRNGKVNTYFTLIFDAEGLSMKQLAYKPGKSFYKMNFIICKITYF